MPEPMIILENVQKEFRLRGKIIRALNNVNLTINHGEIFGVVGLSGSGKTTLTRMILGLTEPSSGEINIKLGEYWIDMTKGEQFNRGRVHPYIGLLHQEYSLPISGWTHHFQPSILKLDFQAQVQLQQHYEYQTDL